MILFCVSRGISAISSMNSVPPCASSSAPTLRALRAVSRLDAEQLDLHVLRRDRGGVDDHDRPVGARGQAVNGTGGKLLAAARRPDDEDAAVGRADLLDRLPQLIGRGRVADERRRQRGELLELFHLALEPRVLERALGDEQQPVGLERLFDEVVGTALDRRNRGLDVAVSGNHHDRQLGVFLLERIEELQAVEAASLAARCPGTRDWAAARRPRRKLRRCRPRCGCRDLRPAGYRRPARGYPPRRQRSGYRMP